MLKELVDGFDYITIANAAFKWDSITGATIVSGVYGLGSAVQGGTLFKTMSTTYATGFVHLNFFTGTPSACTVIAFYDANTLQCDCRMDSSGHLVFTRNGTTLGTSSGTLVANTWYDIVVKVTVNDTTGAMEVYVDLASFLAVSSVDTKNTANASFNQLLLAANANATQRFDNFMFWDTAAGGSGSNNLTTFPTGLLKVHTAWVTGAGANADWTPSAGSNYQNVDETNSDGDTTYNSSATANQVDTFAVTNVDSTTGTIIAIAVNTIDRIDDATARTVSHRVKSSSSTTDGSAFSPSGSFKNHQTLFDLDPNGSIAITIAARNAMNFGYKLIS